MVTKPADKGKLILGKIEVAVKTKDGITKSRNDLEKMSVLDLFKQDYVIKIQGSNYKIYDEGSLPGNFSIFQIGASLGYNVKPSDPALTMLKKLADEIEFKEQLLEENLRSNAYDGHYVI